MSRPFLWISLILIAGLVAGYNRDYSLLIIILFALFIIVFNIKNTSNRLTILFIAIFILGFLLIQIREVRYNSYYSTTRFNDQGVFTIRGIIQEDLLAVEGNKVYLKPFYIGKQQIKYGLIELNKDYLFSIPQEGDIVEYNLKLITPGMGLNPGEFCSFTNKKKQGIYSLGLIEGGMNLLKKDKTNFRYILVKAKKHLLYIINYSMKKPYNQVMKALLLGERNNLPEDWYKNFTTAGANHLLAISGLHIGFIILIMIKILNFIQIRDIHRNIIISIFLLFYIIITGCRPAVFRAGIIALLYIWGPFFDRKGDLFNLLGFSVVLILLIDPYQLFTPGFQFSYTVLIMLVVWYEYLQEYLPGIVGVSLAAQIGSIPITAYYFNLITPIGVLTNIWAIPLVGFLVSAGFISLIIGLFHPIISLSFNIFFYPLLTVLKAGMELMTLIPGGHLEVPSPHPVIVLLSIGIFLFLPMLLRKPAIPIIIARYNTGRKYFFSFISLLILLYLLLPYTDRSLELTFLAVGQGDSIYIELGKHNMLIDGGGGVGDDSSRGIYTVIPFLKYRGIKSIDLVFITHFDQDHARGIVDIIKERKVGLVVIPDHFDNNYLYYKITEQAKLNNIPLQTTIEGDQYIIDDLILTVLNPGKTTSGSRNDNSIVVKVAYKDFTALLTGDLGKTGEARLIKDEMVTLNSTVLKLGHHGSGDSSDLAFLKAVSPREGIISVGYNTYGHPSAEAVERCNSLGIRLWRTDQHGAITIKTDGEKYYIDYFNK